MEQDSTPNQTYTQEELRTLGELVREGVTMALYLCLSLLAVVLALPTDPDSDRSVMASTVFLTAVGLLLAHLLAFTMSSRLVNKGEIGKETRRLLQVQVVAGLTVAVLATIPVLLFSPITGVRVDIGLLFIFVCCVGYLTARRAGASVLRAVGYGVIVFVASLLVLVVKSLVAH